jgi:hypothetical protein
LTISIEIDGSRTGRFAESTFNKKTLLHEKTILNFKIKLVITVQCKDSEVVGE